MIYTIIPLRREPKSIVIGSCYLQEQLHARVSES